MWRNGWGREYRVRDAWFETILDDKREWIAAFHLVIQHGRPVVAELRVFPNEETDDFVNDVGGWTGSENAEDASVPEGGLTSPMLKKVRFLPLESIDVVVARARAHASYQRDLEQFGFGSAVPSKRRPGPKGKSDLWFAKLVREYVNLVEAGERYPVAVLAKKKRRSPEQMRDFIHQARKREVLSQAPKGKAGGHLTRYGEELLAKFEDGA